MNCRVCGTALAETAQFCHKCGASVSAAAAAPGWRAGIPWGIGGLFVGAVLGVLLGSRLHRSPAAAPPVAAGDGATGIDIANMTPDQRAGLLYNKVMTLHAQGQVDSAEFFLPMALQAYAMLPARDADAHYHIGVLDLAGGNLDAALAEADSIRRLSPTHLFVPMLRARVLSFKRDSAGARRAFAEFLRNESAEEAKHLPEYTEHASTIQAFEAEARQATTGRSSAAKPASR